MQFTVSLNTVKGHCGVDKAKGFHQEVIHKIIKLLFYS